MVPPRFVPYRENSYRDAPYRESSYRDGPPRGYYRGVRGPPRIMRGVFRGVVRRPFTPYQRDGTYIPRKRPFQRSTDTRPSRDKKKEVVVPFACTLCTVTMKTEGDISDHLNSDQHSKSINKLYEEFDRRFKVYKDLAKADADLGRAQFEMRKFKDVSDEGEKVRAWRCETCACNVIESQAGHDKKETHRELDSLQNVPCGVCKRKFTTRADFERHLMSFSHYDRLAAPATGEDDEKGFNLDEMATVDEVGEGDEEEEDAGMDGEEGEEKKVAPVVIAPYDARVAVGLSHVEEYRLARCLLCDEEFRARETSSHCKTEGHYERFVEKLREDHGGNIIISERPVEVEEEEESNLNGEGKEDVMATEEEMKEVKEEEQENKE